MKSRDSTRLLRLFTALASAILHTDIIANHIAHTAMLVHVF